MFTRAFTWLLIALLGALMIAGCGGGTKKTPTTTATTPAPATTQPQGDGIDTMPGAGTNPVVVRATSQRAPARSLVPAIFGSASWTRFSPKSRTPAAKASRTACSGCVLLTATSVTSEAERDARSAARAMRSRTAATRSAITSSGP